MGGLRAVREGVGCWRRLGREQGGEGTAGEGCEGRCVCRD